MVVESGLVVEGSGLVGVETGQAEVGNAPTGKERGLVLVVVENILAAAVMVAAKTAGLVLEENMLVAMGILK